MPTTFNVISLGNLSPIDTTEGNYIAEGAKNLEKMVFGSKADPLSNHFHSLSPEADGAAGSDPTNIYNQNADGSAEKLYEHFTIDGKGVHAFDAAAEYNATITYVDGTTETLNAVVVFQDLNGNAYLAPKQTQDSDQDKLEAKPIQSLTLGTLLVDETAGLFASLDTWEFATCFCRGVMIETKEGLKPVELLDLGDLVLTLDHDFQPIRWIGSRKLSSADLKVTPNLRPIRIRAGALGETPDRDLMVSPQHRILIRSKIAQRMFSVDEVLVAAKHLLEIDGIELVEDPGGVEYFHMLFDQHEVVFSNGAATESLYTGPQALKSLSPAARKEIFALFPELQNHDSITVRPSARPQGVSAGSLPYGTARTSIASYCEGSALPASSCPQRVVDEGYFKSALS